MKSRIRSRVLVLAAVMGAAAAFLPAITASAPAEAACPANACDLSKNLVAAVGGTGIEPIPDYISVETPVGRLTVPVGARLPVDEWEVLEHGAYLVDGQTRQVVYSVQCVGAKRGPEGSVLECTSPVSVGGGGLIEGISPRTPVHIGGDRAAVPGS